MELKIPADIKDLNGVNVEDIRAVYFCEACRNSFTMSPEEEFKLNNDRVFIYSTVLGARRKFICDKCYQNNYKFTEHGVLMNETPVKKRVKK